MIISFLVVLVWSACEDPRREQREDNVFDPDNSFIRFDFDNAVNSVAKDSALLNAVRLDTLKIPVALSAPRQQEEVVVRFSVKTEGNIAEGIDFELTDEDGEVLGDKRLALFPGSFVSFIHFREKQNITGTGRRVILRLESVQPSSIHLGFPGSERGRIFAVIAPE